MIPDPWSKSQPQSLDKLRAVRTYSHSIIVVSVVHGQNFHLRSFPFEVVNVPMAILGTYHSDAGPGRGVNPGEEQVGYHEVAVGEHDLMPSGGVRKLTRVCDMQLEWPVVV